MNLDVRTIYMAMGAACFIAAIAIFAFHAGRFQRDGALSWTVGWVLQGAFWALIGLRGIIWNFISVVIASTFLAASFSLLYAAVREFQGRTSNRKILLLPPVVTFVFFWYFSVSMDNIFYRVIFISLLSILQITAIAWALFRDASIQEKRSCRITGIAFLFMGGMWITRLLEGFTLPYGHLSVLEATTFRNASVLVGLGAVILSCIGFMLMRHERAEQMLREGEEQLRQAEEASRLLIKYAPSMIYEVDFRRPAFKSVNDAMCQFLGYTREELLATNPFDLLDDEGKALFQERIRRKLAGEPISDSVEYKSKTKDGRDVHGVLNMTFTYKDGNPEGAVVVAHDITERKQAEVALQEKEVRLAREKAFSDNLINSLPGIFYLFDENGGFLRWNKNQEKVTGYSSQELANMSMMDFIEGDEKELVRRRMKELFENGVGEVEANLVSKDGTKTPYFFTGVRIILEGKMCLLGFAFDVSERKRVEESLRESEERFRSVLDNSLDVIYRLNLHTGKFEYMSPSAAEATGFSKDEVNRMDRKAVGLLVHPDEVEKVLLEYKRIDEKGRGEVVYRQRKKNGEYRWLSDYISITKNKTGMPLYRDGVVRDITERKQAEEELKQNQRLLRDIIDSSPSAIFLKDRDGKFITINKQLEKMLGMTRNELKGKTDYDIASKDVADYWWSHDQQVVKTGLPL